jgi:Spy/CpxP family protein refolding chaperone
MNTFAHPIHTKASIEPAATASMIVNASMDSTNLAMKPNTCGTGGAPGGKYFTSLQNIRETRNRHQQIKNLRKQKNLTCERTQKNEVAKAFNLL